MSGVRGLHIALGDAISRAVAILANLVRKRWSHHEL